MKRLAILFLLLVSLPAFAQETRATLTGHVSDRTGAIIPHAQIVVTNMEPELRRREVQRCRRLHDPISHSGTLSGSDRSQDSKPMFIRA